MRKLSSTMLAIMLILSLSIPSAFASSASVQGTVEASNVVSGEVVQSSATPTAEAPEEASGTVETVGAVGTVISPDSTTAVTSPSPTASTTGAVVSGTTEVTATPSTAPTTAPTVTPEATKDAAKDVAKELEAITGEAYTKGFHVQIALAGSAKDLPYVPTFKVQLADGNGKIISTLTASYTNFNQEKGVFNLIFPVASFKAGDKFKIGFVDGDSVISNLFVHREYYTDTDWETKDTTISRKQHLTFNVLSTPVYGEEKDADGEMITTSTVVGSNLEGSESYPYYMVVEAASNKTSLVLRDTKGNALKNTEIEIVSKGTSKKYTSDSRGAVTVDTKSLPSLSFSVYTKGYLAEGQDPETATETTAYHEVMLGSYPTNEGHQSEYLTYQPLGTKAKNEVAGSTTGSVDKTGIDFKISVDAGGRDSLSPNWDMFELKFTGADGKSFSYDLNAKAQPSYIPAGTYVVSATSENAVVEVAKSVTVKADQSTKLSVTLKPKYVLDIDKDGKSYKFKLLNVDTKEYKGKDVKSFIVSYGESYVIQDVETGVVHTVTIAQGSPKTKVVLGAGLVFGGTVSTPHTGDDIFYLLGLLIASVVGAGVFYILHTKSNRRRLGTKALSLLLVVGLIASMAPFPIGGTNGTAYAVTDGGNPGGTTGDTNVDSNEAPSNSSGGKTPTGLIQTSDKFSIFRISMIPARSKEGSRLLSDRTPAWMLMKEYGSDTSPFVFTPEMDSISFYMGTNNASQAVLKSKNLGVYTYDYDKKSLGLRYGSNTLGIPVDMSNRNSIDDFSKFILKTAEQFENASSSEYNAFEDVLSTAIKYNMGAESATRRAWAGSESNSTSKIALGGAINTAHSQVIKNFEKREDLADKAKALMDARVTVDSFKKLVSEIEAEQKLDVSTIKVLVDEIAPKVEAVLSAAKEKQYEVALANYRMASVTYNEAFKSYLTKLDNMKTRGHIIANLLQAYKENEDSVFVKSGVALVIEMVPVFYENGTTNYAIMPMHDSIEWYLAGMQKAQSPSIKGLTPNQQSKIVWDAGKGLKSDNPINKTYPTNTYIGNARASFATALRVKTSEISVTKDASANVANNPSAGWGYIMIPSTLGGSESANTPKLDTEVVYTLEYADGTKKTLPPVSVPEYSSIKLSDGYGDAMGGQVITIPLSTDVSSESGKLFKLQSEGKLSLIDVNKKTNLLSKLGNFSSDANVNVDSKWVRLSVDYHLPRATVVDAWLGGDANIQEGNDYYNAKDPAYGNAKLTLNVTLKEFGTSAPQSASYIVPQWRLSQEFNFVGDIKPTYSTTGDPAGGYFTTTLHNFKLPLPEYEKPTWLRFFPYPLVDEHLIRSSTTDLAEEFNLGADTIVIRNSNTVDNIKLASWKNDSTSSIMDERVTSTTKGEVGTASTIPVSQEIKVNVDYNGALPAWYYADSESVPTGNKDKFGNPTYSTRYFTSTGTTTPSQSPQKITIDAVFNRYLTKTLNGVNAIDDDQKSVDGFYFETKRLTPSLFVYPEVMMLYTDYIGRTSTAVTAADRIREIKPIAFNSVKYINPMIDPVVTGMSTATDAKAKALNGSLGMKKDVIYKGSSTTNSTGTTGKVELKSYVLDIGDSAVKTAWGNSAYSAQTVADEFLNRYTTKNATSGLREVTFDVDANYVINNQDVGGTKGKVKSPQSGTTTSATHSLEVRGGVLIGVDGSRDLASVNPELLKALEEMGIKVSTKAKGIFLGFDANQGDALKGEKDTDLNQVNAIRGTGDWQNGKPWYNEDTTVLVVREYTSTFAVPQYTYTDKLPMMLAGLETPADMNQFFSKGFKGYVAVRYDLVNSYFTANTSTGKNAPAKAQFVVPNVTVEDTFRSIQ